MKTIECTFAHAFYLGKIAHVSAQTHAAQVYRLLDSQYFLLPQRRNRVWGMGTLISPNSDGRNVENEFLDCLESMHSNVQFPVSRIFETDLPKENPRNGREKSLVTRAQEAHPGTRSIFVDTSTSLQRPCSAPMVVPCITPSHPYYSTALERYLSPRDLMHCQGFWPSTLSPKTYKLLTEDEVKKGQDMIGNSFSTTVFQAVLLASLASAPAAWETIQTRAAARQCGDQKHCQVAPLVLRRVQGKRRSPAYDFALVHKKVKEKSRSNAKVRKKRVYCRKKKGLDSRKFSKGKRAEATLWEKEQVSPSCM